MKTKVTSKFLDPLNVMMMITLEEYPDHREIIDLPKRVINMQFKFVGELDDGIVLHPVGDKTQSLITKVHETKFCKEYYDMGRKMANLWYNKTSTTHWGQLWMWYDKEKKEVLSGKPVLLVFDRLAFLLAPRVDDE